MATDIERLILEVSATSKGLERGLNAINKKIDASTAQGERRFKRMNKNILMSTSSMTRDLGSALAAVGVAYATREVVAYADAWTRGKNALSAAGIESERVAATQGRIADIARDTRSELDGTFQLYTKLTRATADLGASQEAVARATEIINKGFQAGGAAASEQQSAILQLGQALQGGILQGDELKSLRDSAPLLLQAIAKEYGVTVGALKKLGAEGKLTSDRIFRGIINSGAAVDAQFAKTESTVGAAFENLRTSAIEWIGTQDQALGASQAFVGFLEYATANLDTFADATIVGATILGGVFAGQAVMAAIRATIQLAGTLGITRAAMIAQGGAATFAAGGMNALRASMAFLGGPWGIAIAAIATAIGLIWYESNRSVPPTEELAGAIGDLDGALQAYETASVAASAASGESRKTAIAEANALRTLAVEARNSAAAKIEEARATIARARAANAERQANLAASGRDPGLGTYNATMPSTRSPGRGAVRQAESDLAAGEAAIKKADDTLARIDANLNRPLTSGNPAAPPDSGAGGGRGGPTPADLRAEAELDAARERSDEGTIRRLEDQLDLKRRIADYEDAGLKGAAARAAAEADQALVVAARAEAMARERDIMGEEVRLQAAQAAGDEDLVRSLDRAIQLRERSRSYEELGLATAEARARAEADLATIEAGRQTTVAREVAAAQKDAQLQAASIAGEIEIERELSAQVERRDTIADYQSRGLTLTQATAQAEADLASIEAARMAARRKFWIEESREQERRIAQAIGDEQRLRQIDREREIADRSERYRRDGGMSRGDADARARSEVDAESIAEVRGKFRDAFKDGWKAALDGEFEEWLAERAAAGLEKAAERGLEMLADYAFDQLQKAFPGVIDNLAGITADTSAAATMATAITTSATTGGAALAAAVGTSTATGSAAMATAIGAASTAGAAAMGAAITAAGAAAAATMAAAIAGAQAGADAGNALVNLASSFGTGRAGGGHVRAGMTYPVNELGREGFSPGFNGTIVPADVLRALASLRPGANRPASAGIGKLTVENHGEPMTATTEQQPNGDMLLRLEPVFDRGIESQARSGKLQKHLKKSPRPERQF